MKDKNRPPKFRPDKGTLKQMREMYDFYMGIAYRDGISEQTLDNIITGLVKRIFEANHDKNWYKNELRRQVATETAKMEIQNTCKDITY